MAVRDHEAMMEEETHSLRDCHTVVGFPKTIAGSPREDIPAITDRLKEGTSSLKHASPVTLRLRTHLVMIEEHLNHLLSYVGRNPLHHTLNLNDLSHLMAMTTRPTHLT